MPFGVNTNALTLTAPDGRTLSWLHWWDAEDAYKALHAKAGRSETEEWLYLTLAHKLCQHQLAVEEAP